MAASEKPARILGLQNPTEKVRRRKEHRSEGRSIKRIHGFANANMARKASVYFAGERLIKILTA